MHNAPGMPVGSFGVKAGVVAAAGAFFDIDIHGRGGHGAHPHLTVDPVVVGAQLVSALQSVVARNVKPADAAVLSVTHFTAATPTTSFRKASASPAQRGRSPMR